MDVRPEKFISGEGFDYRITLADGLSGYALMLVIAFLSYPLFDDQISHFLSRIISGEIDVWLIAVALLALVPLSIPVGLLFNALSFILIPHLFIGKISYYIHKFLAKIYICLSKDTYFCKIVNYHISEEDFYKTADMIRAIHKYMKNKRLLSSSVKMADRTIGLFIFFRSLSLVVILYSIIYYTKVSKVAGILFLYFCIVLLFLSSMSLYYALIHILRGLYGNYVVKCKKLPRFVDDPIKNVLLLLQALDS